MLPSIKRMRLQRVQKPFDNSDYVFELKHDGFRAIAYIEDHKCNWRSVIASVIRRMGQDLAWFVCNCVEGGTNTYDNPRGP